MATFAAVRGWKLTIAVSLGLVALTALQLALWGTGEEGVRVVVRSSARSSMVLFALAFGASSLRALWRSRASAWLLTNRRHLGVSFAASHTIHLVALVALHRVSASFAADLEPLTLVGGGLAYVFVFAMAATSSDAAVAALGRARWRRLHQVGGWYIWAIFAQSYLGRVLTDPTLVSSLLGLLVLAVPALRIARWLRRPAREGAGLGAVAPSD